MKGSHSGIYVRPLIMVNNAPRKKLGGPTPYQISMNVFGEEILKKQQLRYVSSDEATTFLPELLK